MLDRRTTNDRSRDRTPTALEWTARSRHAARDPWRSGLRRRDTANWEGLHGQCIRTAKRLGADHIDAEELAQEAIVRLLPVHSSVRRPAAWLNRVVRHLRSRQLRRRALRARGRSEIARQWPGDWAPGAIWRDEIEIHRVLDLMRPRSRRLLELVLSGYTHREIARALGCETHQVGPRIARVLETARRRLKLSR